MWKQRSLTKSEILSKLLWSLKCTDVVSFLLSVSGSSISHVKKVLYKVKWKRAWCSICGVKLSIICCLQAEKCALKNYALMCFSYYFWALCLCFLFGLYHIEISLIKKGYVCPSMEASSLRLIPIHFYVTLTSRLMNTPELASLTVLFTNVHNRINRLEKRRRMRRRWCWICNCWACIVPSFIHVGFYKIFVSTNKKWKIIYYKTMFKYVKVKL